MAVHTLADIDYLTQFLSTVAFIPNAVPGAVEHASQVVAADRGWDAEKVVATKIRNVDAEWTSWEFTLSK